MLLHILIALSGNLCNIYLYISLYPNRQDNMQLHKKDERKN